MTDRELLLRAASAAHLYPHDKAGVLLIGNTVWNPLDDDGDAFRLLVKRRLFEYMALEQRAGHFDGPNAEAAVRRTITKAAGEETK